MRLFYRTYPIYQISDKLDWSNYVTLLSVKDENQRKILENRAVDEGLNYIQLKRIVAREYSHRSSPNEQKELQFERGFLHTYSLMDPSRLPGTRGSMVIDCGFNIWKNLPVKDEREFRNVKFITSRMNKNRFSITPAEKINSSQIYTYKAYIEKIIDGDTLWAVIDCGFSNFTRQKLRLRGIDAPELNTAEGEKAKKYFETVLKDSPFVIIKTYKSDKYDRYLSDIFYLPDEGDSEKIAATGKFLNSELVKKSLAEIV
jgi:endonuclease YncB( thermonuclease family)